MSAFAVVTIKQIKDVDAFRDYAVRVTPIVERHGGRWVAVDKHPNVCSGEWPFVRTLIVEYPDFASAQAWHDDPEYQQIVPLRTRAIDANVVIVRSPAEAGIDMDPRKSGA